MSERNPESEAEAVRSEAAVKPAAPGSGAADLGAKSNSGASGSDAVGAGASQSRRRDWARLRRLLPAVLLPWAAALVVCYIAALRFPAPGFPGPIDWALTPLAPNPFSACRAEFAPEPVGTSAPAPVKASGLIIRSALAQEAPTQGTIPNLGVDPKQQVVPAQQEQQQIPQQQQQQQQQQIPEQQQQLAPDGSGSTGGGFAGPFDVAPAFGCDELGFGDLIDVAMDETGDRAWVINRYGLLYASADGGTTWRRQTLPEFPADALLSAIATDDAGRNLAVAVRLAPGRFGFYRSADGGATWRLAPEMELNRSNVGGSVAEIAGLSIGSSLKGSAAQPPEQAQAPASAQAQPPASEGTFLVAVLAGAGEAVPAVWRDDATAWAVAYEAVEAEMLHRLRTHDFGTGVTELGATGSATLPIATWNRMQGDNVLIFSIYDRDPKSSQGALTADASPAVQYMIGAKGLHALAASDDGLRVFGAEAKAILRGDSQSGQWSRIDLAPLAGTEDFSLAAIDVAKGDQVVMAVGRNALFVSQNGGAAFLQPRLARYPAPWFYLVLLSGPLFAFYVMRPGKPETLVINADESKALSDRALSLKDADALNLRAYAEGISDLLRNTETKPPLVIGITGPWGSGKSSIMQMLSELLARREMPVVWFNAWHHQSEEHLLASLLSNIRRQGVPGFFTRPGLRLRWRLMLQRLTPHLPLKSFLWSWALLLAGIALLSGALAFWLMPPVNVEMAVEAARASNIEVRERVERTERTSVTDGVETVERVEKTEKNERRVGGEAPRDAGHEIGKAVAAIQDFVCATESKHCRDFIESTANLLVSVKLGALITLLLGLIPLNQLKQVALVTRSFDPGKLMTSMMPASRNPKLDEQLSFRHGFGEELRATIAALAPYRLVIFIDDLDRCRPENVAAVLEAVNFVVSAADCYVVLGMDRAYVLRAIRQEFEKFIEMEREERKELALIQPEEDKGRPRDFAEHYLEKLVNLIVSVPKMTPEARSKLMDSLASRPPRIEDAAPRFDWWRWGRRTAAIAAILAALLGPALYVSTLAPPERQTAPTAAPSGNQGAQQGAGDANAGLGQGNVVRTETPQIAELTGAPADSGLLPSGLGPILLGVGALLALAGIAWAAVRAVSVPPNLLVRDSTAFKDTLRAVEARLAGFMTTPRRAKRFVNRLRLFGAMLRSPGHAVTPEREAELDRAVVQAGALHALARELLLAQQNAGTAPDDPAERAAWETARQQAADAQRNYREAMAALYRAVGSGQRPAVDALYWRFWQLSDGASLGDPAVTAISKAGDAPMLLAPAPNALDEILAPQPAGAPAA